MSDDEFLDRFESLGIPGSEFRHKDHIRLAWIYLQDPDFATGAARFSQNFRRFVRHIGAEPKYHETITWFYLVVISERIRTQTACASWEAFAACNGDLLDNGMGLLRDRYQEETLNSPLARGIFLLPDRPQAGASRKRSVHHSEALKAGTARRPTIPFARTLRHLSSNAKTT